MKSFKFIILALLLNSCVSTVALVDSDDLYYQKHVRSQVSVRNRRPYFWSDSYYQNNFWWEPNIIYPYQPRTIIIVPQENKSYNYGKRPSREGNNTPSPLNRRGRN